MKIRKMEKYENEIVFDIWLNSVKATHHFISNKYLEKLKPLVRDLIKDKENEIFVLEDNGLKGFAHIENNYLEMLFIDSKYFGNGYGTALLSYAIKEKGADKLTVNQENKKALKFYTKAGFEIFKKDEKDPFGMNHPILHMHLT